MKRDKAMLEAVLAVDHMCYYENIGILIILCVLGRVTQQSSRPWKSWVTRLQILQFLTSFAFGVVAMKQMWELSVR